MLRSKILGLGSYVPDRVVTNDDLAHFDNRHVRHAEKQIDITDEWVRERTGVEQRRYVPNDESTTCSDLAQRASLAALEDAGISAKEIDCIIYATLSPDIHFPGSGVFLQTRLGIGGAGGCPCFDIRQQCSGFIYGLQMADSLVLTGHYKRILVVGAELHSHSLDFTTRGRDVMILFGDGAGAAIVGPVETENPREGILYTKLGADGGGAKDLHLNVFDSRRMPHIEYTPEWGVPAQAFPQMNGKKVFLNAVRAMNLGTRAALEKMGFGWDDVDWFVPHQANLRINEAVARLAEIPAEKVLNTIQIYGNTTAATVPLTIDHHRKAGRVKKGDLVVSSVFGAGFTWGTAIFSV